MIHIHHNLGMIRSPLILLFLLGYPVVANIFDDDDAAPAGIKCFADKWELKAAVDEYISGDCGNLFSKCNVTHTYGSPIGSWCVGNVTDMSELFFRKDTFNDDLSGWDVSKVTTMWYMFEGSSFNGDISNWDISSVYSMSGMFSNSFFNGDVSKWDVSSVTYMNWMFMGSAFNSDISSWDVSSVIYMSYMLNGATSFNRDLCAWSDKFPYDNAMRTFEGSGCTFQHGPYALLEGPFCASQCNNSYYTADQCFGDGAELRAAVNIYIDSGCSEDSSCLLGQKYGWPIGTWCVGYVTDMSYLFYGKTTFNEDLSGWNLASVNNAEHMFRGSGFNGDISEWNVASVTKMSCMFCSSFFNSDVSKWDVSSVISMDGMFAGSNFDQDLCSWGDKFPYNNAKNIFANSGCTYQDTPQLDQRGPFCASDCTAPNLFAKDTPSPTTMSPTSNSTINSLSTVSWCAANLITFSFHLIPLNPFLIHSLSQPNCQVKSPKTLLLLQLYLQTIHQSPQQ